MAHDGGAAAPEGPSSLFAPENRQKLESSFKEFLARPENKPLVEEHQAKEVRTALRALERTQDALLKAQVLALGQQEQEQLAPLLRTPLLRRLLQSMCAQEGGQPLSHWVGNARVMGLMQQAHSALQEGRISEVQLQDMMTASLKGASGGPTSGGAPLPAELPRPAQMVVPSHMLVEALNEHLAERRAGNTAYQRMQLDVAAHHYKRALSIVELVRGSNPDDQAEIDRNKAATHLNIAALAMARMEWGAAVASCDAALALEPDSTAALTRRCKANLSRHEHQAASRDLEQLAALDPWSEQVQQLRERLAAARRASADDKDLAARMLGLA